MINRLLSMGIFLLSISACAVADSEPVTDQTAEPIQVEATQAANQNFSENTSAVRIYVDPETGKITEPPADVAAEMTAQEQALGSPVDAPFETVTMPGGGVGIIVGDHFNNPVNVGIGCDGKIIEQGHDVDVSESNSNECKQGLK